jgi:pyruvate dehydrogenase E2 component (dihydrolipoamide acetyltransferase)
MTDLLTVEVPDIGEFDDIPIIEILVSPGDAVALDDPLLTLESDKATMDVPAPFAGTVKELQVKLGDRVSRGTLLLTMEPASNGAGSESSKASAVASAGASSEAMAPDSVTSAVQAEEASAGPAPSNGDSAPAPPPTPAPAASAGTPPAAAPPPAAPASADTPPAPAPAPDGSAAGTDGGGPVYASPSARRVARELGVDIAQMAGSGRKGRITRPDVEAFAARGPAPAPEAVKGPATASPAGPGLGLDLPPWPSIDFTKFGPVERVARSRIQRISAPVLARNWVMIPHVTHNDEADITDLEAWRKQVNAEQAKGGGAKLTMVSFLIAASVATLKEFPIFNSSLDGDDLIVKGYYNIGFAADTPGGLVVPVIKNADQKGLLEIAAELGELSGKARDGKLGPADMQGGTFTISSLGGIGGTSFTPIVNAPEVAILGVTRSAMKPVWDGAAFVPRLMVPLSLSYDHRVIDGAAAARFTAHLVTVLTDLRRALL